MEDDSRHNIEEGFKTLFNSKVSIKKQRRNKDLKNKALFISLIGQYEKTLVKSVRLQADFAIDMYEYEEPYHQIIDNLIMLSWGKNVYELITFYLYERINLDGTTNYLVEEDSEKEIFLNTPEDLYNYLYKYNPNFLNER